MTVSTNYPTEGSISSKITDAWLYVDDQLIGVFQVPVTVPVLAQGNKKISIGAGIKKDGIAASRVQYDFYAQQVQSYYLKAGEKLSVTPAINYLSNTVFGWKEDFETVGLSFIKGPSGSDTVMQKITSSPDVFEGTGSGAAYLTGTYFEAVSSSAFTLPGNGNPVYLELNYKTNTAFAVGIYDGSGNYSSALTINPSEQWNKIYIDLGAAVQSGTPANYSISFAMYRDASTPIAELFLDNIKLVHF
ncbi:MAG: hypothetical protein IT235_08190 [Bacteroidia bacterium]|nr:hypothetical protein [Bacteroidia bacterium]